jgi:hypothetical protein
MAVPSGDYLWLMSLVWQTPWRANGLAAVTFFDFKTRRQWILMCDILFSFQPFHRKEPCHKSRLLNRCGRGRQGETIIINWTLCTVVYHCRIWHVNTVNRILDISSKPGLRTCIMSFMILAVFWCRDVSTMKDKTVGPPWCLYRTGSVRTFFAFLTIL